MSRQESLLISACINAGTIRYAIREGVAEEHFTTNREEWEWLSRQQVTPSRQTFIAQFPEFNYRKAVTRKDIPALARTLREQFTQRKLVKAIEVGLKNIKGGKISAVDIAEALRHEASSILETTASGGAFEVVTGGKSILREFKKNQHAIQEGGMRGISFGLESLDKITGGLLPSQLYVVIARQGNFKTFWMLDMAARAMLAGQRVLWVSREMPENMVTYRIHTLLSNQLYGEKGAFSNLSLVLGKKDIKYRDYKNFVEELQSKVSGRLFIPNNRRMGINDLERSIELYAPDIIFYDYIGIISGDDSNRSWQKLGAEANRAKELAMEYKVPFIMASQVNRGSKDLDEAPTVENISFSDSIGYAADYVFALQLSPPDLSAPSANRTLEIWVRKARYGMNDVCIIVKVNPDKGVLRERDSPTLAFGDIREEESTRRVRTRDGRTLAPRRRTRKAA